MNDWDYFPTNGILKECFLIAKVFQHFFFLCCKVIYLCLDFVQASFTNYMFCVTLVKVK